MTSSPDSKTILVADDCAPVGELIELLLCRVGYRVLRATNGADALRLARKTRIDLLLSNLDMPKMRGDELAVRFAAIHPAAPVVFLSSFDHPDEVSEPLDVLTKPFTVAELRDTVSHALRQRAALPTVAQAA